MVKNARAQKLVPLPRELHFDDTMNEVNAVLRFDTKLTDSDLKVQLLVDFRHKKDRYKSKPRFYGTISQPRQFEDLVSASLAIACYHRLRRKEKLIREEIYACYDEIVKWLKEDVRNLVQIMHDDVKKRRAKIG